jgi:hypothetical protein
MWSTRCSTFTSRRGVDHLSDWAIDLTRVRARLEEGQQEFNADTKTWLRICSLRRVRPRDGQRRRRRAPSACMSFGEVLCVSGCV